MERVLLSADSRKILFEKLKERHNASNCRELALRLKVGYWGLKQWRLGKNYLPRSIIPQDILDSLDIMDEQEEGWGCRKGGLQGGLNMARKKYPQKMKNAASKGGKHSAASLKKWKRANPQKHAEAISKAKIRKRTQEVREREKANEGFFVNQEAWFNLSEVTLSAPDKKRGLKLPTKLTPALAEEIGIHTGDGTLPVKKYYFSVRGDIEEREYYTGHVIPLYKKIFGIDIQLLERAPICGIEVSSKGIYLFKKDVIGLPVGKKVGRVEVPDCIIQSRNKEIIKSFIRGVFDTDGSVYCHRNRRCPAIEICVKSEKFINKTAKLLELLGFFPRVYNKCLVVLYGPVMFNKWVKDIGSNNPKHLKRFRLIQTMLPSSNG